MKIPRRYVQAWLNNNEAYSTTKRLLAYDKTVFKHGHTTQPFKQLNVDLKDQQGNPVDGNRYILVAVDAYSRYLYARPIKEKTGPIVAKAMKSILDSAKRNYANVFSDNGKEFISKPFKKVVSDHGASQYFSSAQTPQSNLSERFMDQISRQITRYKNLGKPDWPKLLPTIIKSLNQTINQGMGNLTPEQVQQAFLDGDQTVLTKVDEKMESRRAADSSNMSDKIQYSPGDLVRIRLESQGDTLYSREAYQITRVDYNRNGRDPGTKLLNYATVYRIKPFRFKDGDYQFKSQNYTLPQLKSMAK